MQGIKILSLNETKMLFADFSSEEYILKNLDKLHLFGKFYFKG